MAELVEELAVVPDEPGAEVVVEPTEVDLSNTAL